jgi:GT2 family glycosyltransferase
MHSKRVIWLNDDTEFKTSDFEYFIGSLEEEHHIVACRLYAKNAERNIYGVPEGKGIIPVESVNGNFTSISRDVFKAIGNIDNNKFAHFADAPYLDLAMRSGFSLHCNTNVTVYIEYDVLRHLPIWIQVILRNDKVEFLKWMLFDIRSKWFINYRFNYYRNKHSSSLSFMLFIPALIRDWFPVIAVLPFSLIFGRLCKKIVLNKVLLNKLSSVEYTELKTEVDKL